MNSTTILIVEDDAIVATDLDGKLRQLGYEVAGIAADGQKAVQLADRFRPSLVIMDIRLEESMDGIQAAEEIQRRHDVPVIYLTAHSDAATLERAKISGSFGYIPKPFEERELATQIELALYKHRIDRQNRQQRELLGGILTSIGDGVISADAEGCINFINPVAESLTGWKAGDAVGLSVERVFRVVNEQTGQALEAPVGRVLHEGRTVVQANHEALVTKDGRTVPIEYTATPILDAAGEVIGATLVFRDVTGKRQAGETLREREERFRSAFGNAAIGFAMTTPEGRFVDANSVYCQLTGYDIEELRAMELPQMIHPDDFEVNISLLGRMLAGRLPDFIIENRYSRKDGVVVWVRKSVSLVRDGGGVPQWVIILVEDITDRKEAEKELRRSEDRFRLLSSVAGQLLETDNPQELINELCRKVMDHMDCHVFFNFLLDENVGRLRLNAYAGIPEQEAVQIEWLDLGKAVCGYAAQEGCRVVAEDIFHNPDTRTDLVKSYGIQAYACHPLMVQGNTIGTLSFGTKTRTSFSSEDLELMKILASQLATAMERILLIKELRLSRHELEQRVQERTVELERKNHEMQVFASAASHDLQEPLRKVSAFGERIKMRYGDTIGEEGMDYLDRMLRATTRMRSLLKHLLDYSRITTKAEPFQEVDLDETIRDVISDLEVTIERTGGRVEVGEFPVIFADPTQMRQLFQNLIGNGLKFHKEHQSPVVKVSGAATGHKIFQFFVEDNGIGFDEKFLDRIFSSFQRLHGRNEYEGVGMGLAICKKIVERHGGTITAESTPGEGSRFIVSLTEKRLQDRD